MRKKTSRRANCDAAAVAVFDYSKLDAAFAALAKPAQRALINARIFTPRDLARWTKADIAALHGIGPSAFPVLKAALRKRKLTLKAGRSVSEVHA